MKKNFDTLVLYVILFLSIATFVSVLFGCAFRKGKEHFSDHVKATRTIQNMLETPSVVKKYYKKKKFNEQVDNTINQNTFNQILAAANKI